MRIIAFEISLLIKRLDHSVCLWQMFNRFRRLLLSPNIAIFQLLLFVILIAHQIFKAVTQSTIDRVSKLTFLPITSSLIKNLDAQGAWRDTEMSSTDATEVVQRIVRRSKLSVRLDSLLVVGRNTL